jgi:hypothetical protein
MDSIYHDGMRLPGFARVIATRTLAIPDYDSNGMYRTWGNVLVNPYVGLLFLNFENPKRVRVSGNAHVREEDLRRCEFPGSVFIARVTAELIFPNCPRYIPPDEADRAFGLRAASRLYAASARLEDVRLLPRRAAGA